MYPLNSKLAPIISTPTKPPPVHGPRSGQPPPSLRPEYGGGAVESGCVRDRPRRGLGHHARLADVRRGVPYPKPSLVTDLCQPQIAFELVAQHLCSPLTTWGRQNQLTRNRHQMKGLPGVLDTVHTCMKIQIKCV